MKMFTTSILKCLQKNQILVKIFHLLSSIWTLFFKLPQILGQIQILTSVLKKHDYDNLVFEVHANKS
jgi:MFS-type transporter involved in bile tolerance (Atg22 family)